MTFLHPLFRGKHVALRSAGALLALSLAMCQSAQTSQPVPVVSTAADAPAVRDPAALARSRLYHAPTLSGAANAADVDNVYEMQIIALPHVDRMGTLGRRIFFDTNLSGSGKMSCASCHSPAFAYGPSNDLSAQMGGPNLDKMGNRAVPSLRYKERLPAFTEHYFDEDTSTGVDQGPTGGFGWEGLFSTPHIQAGLPLLAPNEMANASVADVAGKLRRADYAPQFRETFGDDALNDDARAFKWMTLALEYFQRNAKEFYPYTSKYDAYLRGQATLSGQEQRGLRIFNDPERGNCAVCHVSKQGKAGAMPQFTDFGLVAIGVPRNPALAINRQPGFYDMGLCGPFRKDLAKHPEYCGAFRTPSLRNVALRKTFMHNGEFHSLREVLDFYATRDTDPARWYPRMASGPHAGQVEQYNDLPEAYRKNVNQEAPFSPDKSGQPRLNKTDVDDLMAFLDTLTDGYAEAPQHTVQNTRAREKEKSN